MGKYKQLSIEERSVIQAQLTLGFKPSWIAVGLERSVSTILRELRRNDWVKSKEQIAGTLKGVNADYPRTLGQ